MKLISLFILFLVVISIPFGVLAEKIFKSVDESGTTSFSDRQTSDSERVNVKPNVVDVNIPKIPPSTPSAKSSAKSNPKVSEKKMTQTEVDVRPGRGVAAAGNLQRKILNETNGEGIQRPSDRPARRPTIQPVPARGGGGR